MAYCPSDCADDDLLPPNPGDCDLSVRKRNIDRIMFFNCGTDLPDPFTCEGLEALVTSGDLTFSSPLANIEVQDPEFEELQVADCLPPDRTVVSRTITFQDRIAVTKTAAQSPQGAITPFYDYDFWQNKTQHKFTLRYGLVFCDGSIVIAKNADGSYMEASLDVFLSYERQGTGGNSYILEIKKGQLQFKGDPLDLGNKPELESDNTTVFDIKECDIL